LILEHVPPKQIPQSIVYFANKDFIVKKAFYIPKNVEILGSVANSNFIFVYYEELVFLINTKSKLFPKPVSNLKPSEIEKLIKISIEDITLDSVNKVLKLAFNNFRVLKKNEKIVVELGIVTEKYIIISELMIELNSSLTEKEFIYMNTLKKFEKLVHSSPNRNFAIMPFEEKQKVLAFTKENNLVKVFDSLANNKVVYTLLIEDDEIIFCSEFQRDGKNYLLVITPLLVYIHE
jgi:hypothetical protein